MAKTVILTILDGWGIGEKNDSNPIYAAKPPTVAWIEKNFPAGALNASGISVGLPWGEEGNSEVGHLTLGAGRVLFQHFLKITKSIENGDFFKNKALKRAFDHGNTQKSAVHLVGLLTKGNVHASIHHLKALVKMASLEKVSKLYLHLFTDGKDSPPRSALKLLEDVQKELDSNKVGEIASISGRFFAMDRGGNWNFTERVYRALLGEAPQKTKEEAAQDAYQKNLDDEYIEPAIVSGDPHPIQANDAVIFFNFREDSMQQISEPFLNKDFKHFRVSPLQNTLIVTMTQYHEKFPAEVAFSPEKVINTLGEVLSKNQKTQLRIAETLKSAHVTNFFNGLHASPFPNEYRVIIPSEKIAHREESPKMMARDITNRALVSLTGGGFDFILINYANPDVIAHTGNFASTVEAIKTVDQELNKLAKAVLDNDHILVITSDHGNAENVFDLKTGEPQTSHDPNPVPFYLVGQKWQRTNKSGELRTIGFLSDVAPTILEILGIPQPKEMTGSSLLETI